MNSNLLSPLATLDAEHAQLAPKIAALDVKIAALAQQTAEEHRRRLETGKGSPTVERTRAELLRLTEERAHLVRRDQELGMIRRQTEDRIASIRARMARRGVGATIAPELYAALLEAETDFARAGDTAQAQACRILMGGYNLRLQERAQDARDREELAALEGSTEAALRAA